MGSGVGEGDGCVGLAEGLAVGLVVGFGLGTAIQADAPTGAACPASQETQDTKPTRLYVFVPQLLHTVAPVDEVDFPAAHKTHEATAPLA